MHIWSINLMISRQLLFCVKHNQWYNLDNSTGSQDHHNIQIYRYLSIRRSPVMRISMVWCNTAVSPVLMYRGYRSLALNHLVSCIVKLGQHWFRFAISQPILNHCQLIVPLGACLNEFLVKYEDFRVAKITQFHKPFRCYVQKYERQTGI